MIKSSDIFDSPSGLPEDLRAWIDARTLVRLVFESLQSGERSLVDPSRERGLPPGSPRLLLTVLTYSYAVALYSSEEIERRLPRDAQLYYLSAKTCPSGNDLRRFRRLNRVYLEESLSRLFGLAWRARHLDFRGGAEVQTFGQTGAQVPTHLLRLFELAAQRRIDRAILEDTMALDV